MCNTTMPSLLVPTALTVLAALVFCAGEVYNNKSGTDWAFSVSVCIYAKKNTAKMDD